MNSLPTSRRQRLFAPRRGATGLWLLVLALAACSGCSASRYAKSADKEVYGIIQKKQERSLGEARPFHLGERPGGGAAATETAGLTPAAVAAGRPMVLSLATALDLATCYNRSFQGERDRLYLSALDLTLERYQFTPHWSGVFTGGWERSNREEQVTAGSQFGVSQLLATGGRIGASLTTSALRYVTGRPRPDYTSVLALDFAQPLWRGAGVRIATENLTQAERNTIYAVRRFARFRKTFSVSIATSYYRILEQRDVVGNEERNYRNLIKGRERAEALAQAGRLPMFEVDQSRQDELQAHNRYILAQQRLQDRLDDFKIDLGLAQEVPIAADEKEIAALRAAGLVPPKITLDETIAQAFQYRLDLLTTVDAVADAERKVYVARDNLGPDLDITLNATLGTPSRQPTNFQTSNGSYSAGARLDLPLNRLEQRNAYRRAQVALEQARRDYSLAVDQIRRDLQRDWRQLQQTQESYRIQEAAVALAQRRVESVNILLEGGRATTRDLLDAQNALLQAQNALTTALIDYQVARLGLGLDTGLLHVDENGLWWKAQNDLNNAAN